MTAETPQENAIRAKAAEYVTRRDGGWTTDEAAEFALWRAANPAHEAAVKKIEATQQLLGRLAETPAAAAMLDELNQTARNRRVIAFPHWARWMVAVAAAACVAGAIWFVLPRRGTNWISVAADHTRTVDLTDGSTMQMSAGSRVEILFQPAERRINLRDGLVQFSVAKDPRRPFIVAAGPVSVRAIGTAFRVRHSARVVEVAVTEGKVQVTRQGTEAGPLFLVAGEGASFSEQPGAAGGAVTGVTTMRPAGWHAPRLEFSNTPLTDVVARFNQYSRVQIELGDPELAARPVGGTFDADQAEVFVNLLVTAGDVRVDRISETHLVLHRVP